MSRNTVRTHIYRYLANDLGEKLMNKNYASTSASANGSKVFYYSASTSVELTRILFYVTDTKGMEPEEYGNIGSALATGYFLQVWNSAGGSAQLDLCDGLPLKTNGEIGALCYDVSIMSWTNTTNEAVVARFTFERAGKALYLTPGMRFQVTFSDDLSGLIDHRMMLQGHQKKNIR
jgi:hypothetical protein